MTEQTTGLQNPFQQALGDEPDKLPLPVRQHFSLAVGKRLYRGTMRRIWHRDNWQGLLLTPILKLASLSNTLFAETGINVPFELENSVFEGKDGLVRMSWRRTFELPGKTRRFDAVMAYDKTHNVILDWFGEGVVSLEAELLPEIQGETLVIRSLAQRLVFGKLKIPLPPHLTATATVREWAAENGQLEINVRLENSYFGAFFGYEGSFSEVGS